jgi:hypothetical protein
MICQTAGWRDIARVVLGIPMALGLAAVAEQAMCNSNRSDGVTVAVIQAYEHGTSAVRSANPDIELTIVRDAELDEPVLSVAYPESTGNPAGRDVWCDAEDRNWTEGRAISFKVRSDQALRLSVSFMDGNRVAYTHWLDVTGGAWQTMEIPFSDIKPNPYFQPPGADRTAPLDVSNVARLGFAPQTPGAGHLTIGPLLIVR